MNMTPVKRWTKNSLSGWIIYVTLESSYIKIAYTSWKEKIGFKDSVRSEQKNNSCKKNMLQKFTKKKNSVVDACAGSS